MKISLLEVEHLLPGHGRILSGRDLVKSNFSDIENYILLTSNRSAQDLAHKFT